MALKAFFSDQKTTQIQRILHHKWTFSFATNRAQKHFVSTIWLLPAGAYVVPKVMGMGIGAPVAYPPGADRRG